jgi:hypothetical protein
VPSLVRTSSVASSRCTDSRTAATPSPQIVVLLHAVYLAVPAHRHPRLSPCRFPRRGSPRPCKVFVKLSGSSSPSSSTAAAPLQVTFVATSGHRRSRRLHRHLRALRLRHQRHRLVLDKSTPTTAGGFGPSSPLCVSQPLWSLVS